jgi:hypothetical protein
MSGTQQHHHVQMNLNMCNFTFWLDRIMCFNTFSTEHLSSYTPIIQCILKSDGQSSQHSAQATKWMIRGLKPDRKKELFFPPKHPHQLWGPLGLLFNGCLGLSLGVKWPRYNTDQSPRLECLFKSYGQSYGNHNNPF